MLGALLEDLRQTIVDAVTTNGAGAPGESYVSNGELAWARCCGGSVAIVPLRSYPSRVFPTPEVSLDASICDATVAHDIAIVALRCAPTVDNQGRSPSAEAISESSAMIYADATAVMRAALCWAEEQRMNLDVVVRDQVWVGPSGGCGGTSTTLTVEVPC